MKAPTRASSELFMLDEYEALRLQAIERSAFSGANLKARSQLWELISCGMAAWLMKKTSGGFAFSETPLKKFKGASEKVCPPELLTILTDMTLSNIQGREASCIMI